ncbi:MAG: serine/threonine-protein kinase [Pirellulaceae bacterium]|nr:serine/threonine-protein kinase [Pirellulaceae bacterium]
MLQLLNPLKAALKQPGNGNPSVSANTAAAAPAQQGKAMKFTLSTGDKPLAGYTIKRGVGIGGFGEVYFAVNDAGKEVALKRIQRNLDIEVRGVRQCLNLKHPNLIALYDIQFDQDQQGWIVMEYVAGPSLRDMVDRYPNGMPATELRSWFSQIASAVTYLHDHGIVHRDLKPANIFADEGIVKIGDYGLSKFISCSRRGGQTESVGTFHYMAPEIGKGEYGKEIDIYALGIMLYEMATGCVPFDGESSQEIIMKHLTADPDLSRVSSPVREVVAKALQKNSAHRFSDVREMITALGMELDQRYMVIDRLAVGSAPGNTTGNPIGNAKQAGAGGLPPVLEPIPLTYAAPGSDPPRGAAGKPVSTETQTRLRHEEPIAHMVKVGWRRMSDAWNTNQLPAGARAAVIAVVIILSIMNLGAIIAVAISLGSIYLPYYIIWSIVMGSSGSHKTSPKAYDAATLAHKPAAAPLPPVVQPVVQRAVAKPGPAIRPPVPKPLSMKQWRVAKRRQLALAKPSMIGAELTGSWMGSAVVIAVFTALVAIFQIGSGTVGQPSVVGLVWSAVMAFLCATVAITLGKRWQTSEGDSALRSFIQLTFGLALGGVAYLLSEYLMVPWPAIATKQGFGELPVRRWSGFFDADGAPMLAAYLAYFPLLMGLVHWWKQADPLRRTHFSLFAVLWTVLMAGLVHLIVPFPQPWGALVFAGTSVAVQMATPWYNSDERLELTQQPMV